MSRPIRITIVFDSTAKACEAACGIDWNNPESIDLARSRIQNRFGKMAGLELLDMAADQERLASIIKRTTEYNPVLPLLLINGEIKIAGEFDIRQVIDAVEVVKEIDEQ